MSSYHYFNVDLPSLHSVVIGVNSFFAAPSVTFEDVPSLTEVVIPDSGNVTGFNGVLMKLVQSPTPIPIVTDITSITIPSFSYNSISILALAGFAYLNEIIIGDNCFNNVTNFQIQQLPNLQTLIIGSYSLMHASIQINGILDNE